MRILPVMALVAAATTLTCAASAKPGSATPKFLPANVIHTQLISETQPVAARVNYDPNAANLDGLVTRLGYTYNPTRLSGEGKAWYSHSAELTVGFDPSLKPIDCKPDYSSTVSQANIDEACRQLLSTLRPGTYDPAFAPAFTRGYLTFDLVVWRALKPALPIRFTDAAHGTEILINYSLTTPGGHCQVWDSDIDDATEAKICAAFLASDAPRKRRFSNGKAMTGKDVEVSAWVVPQPGAQQHDAAVTLAQPDRLTEIVYPVEDRPAGQLLTPYDGRLNMLLASDDYPLRALRQSLSAVAKIELEIDGSGAVKSCRPITSGGYSLFDNISCRLSGTRARFQFSPGHGGYQGVKYLRTTVRWVVPDN